MTPMNIGEAAWTVGVTPKMIRHYESLGLIPEAERTEAGYRLYGERELAMLRFIRQARSVGFSMPQIGELMAYWRDPDRRSHDVKQLALRQLQELEQRQRELDQMRSTLQEMVAQCRGDDEAHCPILERLAAPDERSAQPAAAARARRALKDVRPGERRAPARPLRRHTEPAAPAQFGLATWARSFSPS